MQNIDTEELVKKSALGKCFGRGKRNLWGKAWGGLFNIQCHFDRRRAYRTSSILKKYFCNLLFFFWKFKLTGIADTVRAQVKQNDE